jgi:ABC-type phosphate transport system substrate-binding protein
MSNKYPLIAAAVAVAVASGYADAAPPTFAAAANPTVALTMAGSSAAAPAVANFIENTVCGGTANVLAVTSAGGTKNFLAYSCQIPAEIDDPIGSGAPILAGSVVTVYYRTEGGSVVGALPVATNHTIKRLLLSDSSCTGSGLSGACTVNGSTTTSGLNDTWAGAVTNDVVQLGVTDVEPGQLTANDYPTNYASSAFGSATPAQMRGLTTSPLLQQVFGLYVNTSGQGLSSLNISKETAANILNGTYKDWSKVPDINGQPLTTTSHAITRIQREPGSGTRTAANIYFLNYQCGSTASTPPRPGETLNFSTGDELTAVNSTPGAIGYASIDNTLSGPNSTKFPNLALVHINNVTPNTTVAASGQYDFWFEATLVPNPTVNANSQTATLSDYLQANLPDLSTAPALPDINVIPFASANNNPTVPLTTNGGSGTTLVNVNPFTRSGNSCNVPAAVNF